ncbi:MAG: hypothetical protein HOM11_08415 [Methylococcales bacterium]|jgi:hypothetical protein|nr:hypothetical protein [Methylococcales bacterium]MBT7446024.1 hypothetical protein [Methylococcales bacterium]
MKDKNLVPVQANEKLVKHLKILAVSRNKKIYELADEAILSWLRTQQKEFQEITSLMEV